MRRQQELTMVCAGSDLPTRCNIYCTISAPQYLLHNIYSTISIPQFLLHNFCSTISAPQFLLHNICSAISTPQYLLHNFHSTISTPFSLHCCLIDGVEVKFPEAQRNCGTASPHNTQHCYSWSSTLVFLKLQPELCPA